MQSAGMRSSRALGLTPLDLRDLPRRQRRYAQILLTCLVALSGALILAGATQEPPPATGVGHNWVAVVASLAFAASSGAALLAAREQTLWRRPIIFALLLIAIGLLGVHVHQLRGTIELSSGARVLTFVEGALTGASALAVGGLIALLFSPRKHFEFSALAGIVLPPIISLCAAPLLGATRLSAITQRSPLLITEIPRAV